MSPDQQQVSPSAEGELRPSQRGASLERVLAFSTKTEFPRKGTVAFKFGGSSLNGAKRLLHAATLVRDAAQSSSVTVVVSAMKGVTDRLLHVAHLLAEGQNQAAYSEAKSIVELHRTTLRDLKLERNDHERVAHELNLLSSDLLHEIPAGGRAQITGALFDRLASFGERFAVRLFAAALVVSGVPAVPVASSDFVLTCDNFRVA